MYSNFRNIVFLIWILFIASVGNLTDALAISSPKEDLTTQQFAVKFFDKQAKLKPVKLTDDEYYEQLHPKKDDKKSLWGFVNEKDKWAIKPIFDEVEDFGEDKCALVKLSGYWGMIDRTRSFVIVPINNKIERTSVPDVYVAECPQCLWEEYSSQSYTKKREEILLLAYSSNDKSNIMWRQDGTMLTEIVFKSIQDFDSNKLAVVSTSAGFGLLDSNGALVVNPQYTSLKLYGKRLYRVEENGKFGLVSPEGKVVLPVNYDIVEDWDPTDLIWIRYAEGRKWNAIDSNGNIVLARNLDNKPIWNEASQSVVSSDGKYGILDKRGHFLVECNDEYIEKSVGSEYWTVKSGKHIGQYRLHNNKTQYIEMPQIKSRQTDNKRLLNEYKQRFSSVVDNRLWLKDLNQSTFYSPFIEDEFVSFPFQIQGHNYELQTIWEDTVHFVLKSLDYSKNYRLPFDRKVGCFDLDNQGLKRELYTNEYVMGLYDIDLDGNEELIIALRDNTTPGWNKPSGGCYCAFKINASGQCSFVKSELFSDMPVFKAAFSGKNLKAELLEMDISSRYPCTENFGLKGPVMTTGEYSFDINGQLTKIGEYTIRYDNGNIPLLPDHKGDDYSVIANLRIAQFNQRSIVIEFDTDCMGEGKYEYVGSESWTFNNQGLLESFNPFACNGGCQMYYVYNPSGIPLYEIESRALWSVTRFFPETATYDEFGNWVSMKGLVYSENGTYETMKTRTIEYYTESESGK